MRAARLNSIECFVRRRRGPREEWILSIAPEGEGSGGKDQHRHNPLAFEARLHSVVAAQLAIYFCDPRVRLTDDLGNTIQLI
jgi:hypothetical protein